MKTGFYFITAWNNIKKNYKFYIPQILTGMGLLSCLYIVFTLQSDKRILDMPGGDYLPALMAIGTVIIMFLSVILVFYTNSFLMKQRKSEYGLYNVLGMEKRHIGKIVFWENMVSGMISVILGAVFGVLFYKICSLLICNIFNCDVVLGFDFINIKTIILPVIFFIALYLLTFIVNRINIGRIKPTDMLKSKAQGEKEPKIKWVMLILGIISLTSGYIISITITNPLMAIPLFFLAIFLVIIGTYFIFISGSIFILKCLKNNRKFYYNKKHMPVISGLLYRMKQNAVGLASICILATGVIIMISASASLYSGIEDTLNDNYPQDLYLTCEYKTNNNDIKNVPANILEKITRESASKEKIKIKYINEDKYLTVPFILTDEKLTKAEEDTSSILSTNAVFVTQECYNKRSKEKINLEDDEIIMGVLAVTCDVNDLPKDSLFFNNKKYKIIKTTNSSPIEATTSMISTTCLCIVVKDEKEINDIYLWQKSLYGIKASQMTERISCKFIDRDKASEKGKEIENNINQKLSSYLNTLDNYIGENEINLKTYWDAKESVVGMYGSFLFLGIILGVVCLFATVLIIYYKQISEGYEDKDRYTCMQKVGMSRSEIKKAINFQTLLVFFLPLAFAGINTIFAFPIVNRLLHLILLSNTALFIISSVITFLVFSFVYVIVYLLTAKTYYKIVK